MKLSAFGEKFTSHSGISSLMDDLGNALADGKDMLMMGGGNPAHIPEVEAVFKARLQRIIDSQADFTRFIGTYGPPQGDKRFIHEVAGLFKRHYGWNISEKNIALTHGSQAAFFTLFNMFAGACSDGSYRQIEMPMAPEYIGYADIGISSDFFCANKPRIIELDDHLFKYQVNFDQLEINQHTGALCVSRPTNPTGNVLTDEEIAKLEQLAEQHQIPLIIDSAYGAPFPNLIFSDATLRMQHQSILCFSLSKLGLPATRTGIVIANEQVIQALSGINAIMSLAPNSFGSMMALEMMRDDSVISISNELIRPCYQDKMAFAVSQLQAKLGDLPWRLHKPEGAMFLWLWFKGLPISSQALYERLKARNVLVVSGHYFFTGVEADWQHQHECIRITYSGDQATVEQGTTILAEVIRELYSSGA